jgi:hypothetical protein
MAVTYTTAATRDRTRGRARALSSIEPMDLAIVGASLFALFLVFTAYAGVVTASRSVGAASAAPINLNTVRGAADLEPVLARVFPAPSDRGLAARELFAFLMQGDGGRRIVQDVRALTHVRVDAAAIDSMPTAVTFRGRLDDERARATAAARPAPQSVAVLTSSDLAEIKPLLVVRTDSAVRSSLLLWAILYVLAFQMVSLTWRLKGMKGDRLLLLAAHLLTALGLAAMISRVDPSRDAILFVRYIEGVIAGLVVAAAVSLVNLRTAFVRNLSYVPLLAAFALSVVLVMFGGGPAGSRRMRSAPSPYHDG